MIPISMRKINVKYLGNIFKLSSVNNFPLFSFLKTRSLNRNIIIKYVFGIKPENSKGRKLPSNISKADILIEKTLMEWYYIPLLLRIRVLYL